MARTRENLAVGQRRLTRSQSQALVLHDALPPLQHDEDIATLETGAIPPPGNQLATLQAGGRHVDEHVGNNDLDDGEAWAAPDDDNGSYQAEDSDQMPEDTSYED